MRKEFTYKRIQACTNRPIAAASVRWVVSVAGALIYS